MRGHALLAIGVLVVATTACGIDLAPTPEPGSRQWIIRVDNQSRQEARLVIAEAGTIMGETVGRAEPSTVPPMTSIDVTFTVPPGDDWAIFVSPEQGHGPVVHAVDVPPHAAGELPFSIAIWPDGPPGAAIPNDLGPGWFGR